MLRVRMLQLYVKGAVSWQFSSFCLILPITHPQSPWNLKQAKKLLVNDKIAEIQNKQICLLSIIFEVEAKGINFEKLLG